MTINTRVLCQWDHEQYDTLRCCRQENEWTSPETWANNILPRVGILFSEHGAQNVFPKLGGVKGLGAVVESQQVGGERSHRGVQRATALPRLLGGDLQWNWIEAI